MNIKVQIIMRGERVGVRGGTFLAPSLFFPNCRKILRRKKMHSAKTSISAGFIILAANLEVPSLPTKVRKNA